MFPAKTNSLFLFLLLNCCVDKNDYPLTAYRNATDLQFQVAASQDNFDVLNEGSIVVAGAASPAVRSYAQLLVNDRATAQAQLQRIADSANQLLPQQPETGDEDIPLRGIAGPALDTTWLRETLLDQDSAIGLYQNEVANGSYAGLIHYANQYLPTMQERRATADSLLRVLQHP